MARGLSGAHSGKHPTAGVHSIKEGLSTRAAKFPDKSTQFPKAPNVSKDATRSSTAATPPTLGPRTA